MANRLHFIIKDTRHVIINLYCYHKITQFCHYLLEIMKTDCRQCSWLYNYHYHYAIHSITSNKRVQFCQFNLDLAITYNKGSDTSERRLPVKTAANKLGCLQYRGDELCYSVYVSLHHLQKYILM